MLIRTQDKLNLVNLEKLNRITIASCEENEGMFDVIGELDEYSDFDYLLGTYPGKDAAIKVMDMIKEAYDRYNKSKILSDQDLAQKITHIPSSIFEMPEV